MKNQIFDVLAGITPLAEFEQWLYQDVEIQCSILEDENILRLMMIDFSGKHVFHELKKYSSDVFDDAEFYVYALEANAKKIVESESDAEVIRFVKNLFDYSEWGDEKDFYCIFHMLYDQYVDFEYSGYLTRRSIIDEMKFLAAHVLDKFEPADLGEKIVLVFGTEDQMDMFVEKINHGQKFKIY